MVSCLALVPEVDAARPRDNKPAKVFIVEELCDRQYASGLEFKKNSRLVDAKDAFVSVIEACPTYRKAFVQLGNIELSLQNFPEAIKNYEKALELDGTDLEAKEALGFAYQRSDRMDDAVDLFQGVLEEEPGRISTIQYLAVSYEQQGKKPEAYMLYAKALQTDPTIAGLEEKLANLSLELKEYEQAYIFTRRQVDRDSTNVDLKRKLAYFHLKAENWEQAVVLYEKLVEQHPDDPGTLGDRELLAYCLNKSGRIEEAFPLYDYILEHTTTPSENTYYLYCSALIDDGRFDKAISVARKGLSIDRDWGCVTYVMAEALSKRGESQQKAKEWDAARESFKQAKAKFAEVGSGSNCYGNAVSQQERQDQLIDRLNKLQAKEGQ
jgi:tetratricopeptide (TPR) repeat protein